MGKHIRRVSQRFPTSSVIAFCLTLVACSTGHADVVPNALFGDHAVLQQGIPVPVWGTADVGERVTVTLGTDQQTAVTDADGKWRVRFDALSVGGPHTMVIEGKNRLAFENILIGEVWVCSGQSNMQWSVRRSAKPNAESAAAQWPDIRLFTVKRKVSGEPLQNLEGSWASCTPETVHNFSAVAYYFGRDIHQMVDVPVGLIHSSWGGTPSDAWTSRSYLESTGDLYTDRFRRWAEAIADYPVKKAAHDAEVALWQAQRVTLEKLGKKVPRRPRAPWGPNHPHRPAGLYNGMIAPLMPYAIRGAIWYQGESNAGRAYQYRTLFPLMIKNWRAAWGQGDFPFYHVQLANYRKTAEKPGDSAWAELREAQSMSLSLPNTGQAVAIDIGEADDIHPKNKQDVGRRLARIALSKTYGRAVTYSGPRYSGMSVEGDKVRLAFEYAQDGLVAPGKAVRGFEIAGEDQAFVWADAKIEGEEVLVWNEDVKTPVAVRYGWADNPVVNLYNTVGLPASPFRTDDWPGTTVDRK